MQSYAVTCAADSVNLGSRPMFDYSGRMANGASPLTMPRNR